ncbi:MAG: twin transmembrane helix small protein [Candidatus Thiodiazotropha sp.]
MNLIFKLPVILLLLFILFSLFQGMYYLAKDDGRDKTRVVRALTLRVVLSLLLFLMLMAGYLLGFLQPHGIGG